MLLLAREVLKKRGQIKKDSEFKYKIEDFGAESLTPVESEGKAEAVVEKEEAEGG